MSDLTKPPPHYYIAYIDEAGDPGITRVKPIDPQGASEWLVMGAVVIETIRELEQVSWVRTILNSIGLAQQTVLHFRDLTEWRKPLVCSQVAKLNLVALAMLSNKKSMRGHRNVRAAARSAGIPPDQVFYNWCSRLLLERITDCCYRHSIKTYGEPRHVQVIFSERGSHYYGRLVTYLQDLKRQGKTNTTFLTKRTIKHEVLDTRLITSRPHHTLAGLQLADIVASSFYQAVDIIPPTNWNPANAKLLQPRIAKENRLWRDYGVALQPTPPYKAALLPDQKLIFEHYGYRF
jgi:hypothetical protein